MKTSFDTGGHSFLFPLRDNVAVQHLWQSIARHSPYSSQPTKLMYPSSKHLLKSSISSHVDPRLPTELYVLLEVAAPEPFGNAVCDTESRPPHLTLETILLFLGKAFSQLTDFSAKLPRKLIYIQFLESHYVTHLHNPCLSGVIQQFVFAFYDMSGIHDRHTKGSEIDLLVLVVTGDDQNEIELAGQFSGNSSGEV
jgi:hypothetical protein